MERMRSPVNEELHARVHDELTAICERTGWDLAENERSYWGTGPSREVLRADLAGFCEPLGRDDIALLNGSKNTGRCSLSFEAHAAKGRAATEQVLAAFVVELARLRPQLGTIEIAKLSPIGVRDVIGLEKRLARMREFIDQSAWPWRSLYPWTLVRIEPSFREAQLEFKVMRDECGDDDETSAARELTNALHAYDPRLAKKVTIVGDYCK